MTIDNPIMMYAVTTPLDHNYQPSTTITYTPPREELNKDIINALRQLGASRIEFYPDGRLKAVEWENE